MDDFYEKEVKFKDFCCKCEFKEVLETVEPCDSCLEIGAKVGSVVPEKFVEKIKRSENNDLSGVERVKNESESGDLGEN